MRRTSAALLVSLMTSSVLALPAVTLPASAARPVSPKVHTIPLSGLDATGLRESPEPEVEGGQELDKANGRRATSPLTVTGKLHTGDFSALGVTWARSATVADVAVQVRTRSGGKWTDWSEVEVQPNSSADADTSEAAGVSRAGSDPLYVGPSDAVQVRVDAGGSKPRDVQLVLIEPGSSEADGRVEAGSGPLLGGARAEAAESRPGYVSRAGWGADESLRSCTPSTSSTLKGGILHTTATSNDYTAAQSPAIMRSMYAYHTQTLGWCDIGYNFLVDKFGTLFEGRYGGVDRPVIGAHTGGFNSSTVGLSMIGNQDLVAPTAATLSTVQKVFAYKFGLHGINPTGSVTYTSAGGSATSYPAGTVVTKSAISGHRDYSSKSCPGNYAYPLLPSIRTAVAGRMTSTSTPKVATSISLTSTPATITFGQATTLSGRLTTAGGSAVAAKPVKIFVRAAGTTTWGLLSNRTTAADGSFSGTHSAQRNLEYNVQFTGDAEYSGASRTGRVSVAPAISAALSASSTRLGTTVTMKGTVNPRHAGLVVRRQQLIGGTWTTLASSTVTSTGTYSFPVKALSVGTKSYRVLSAADGDHVAGASAPRTLVVV